MSTKLSLIDTPRGRLRSWFSPNRRSSRTREEVANTARQQLEVKIRKSCSLKWSLRDSDGSTPPRRVETAASTITLISIPAKLRDKLGRRLRRGRRCEEVSEHENRNAFRVPDQKGYTGDPFLEDRDALALSRPELELLRRMEQVCQAAEMARERRRTRHRPIVVREQDLLSRAHGLPDPGTRLCLRGGGGDDERGARRRTTLPYDTPLAPRPGSDRPSPLLWWLAGGKVSRKGQVPTFGELGVRKEAERANRKKVGLLGTLLGIRRVGGAGILEEGGGEEDAGSVRGNDEEAVDAIENQANSVLASVSSSSHRSKGVNGGDVEEAAKDEAGSHHHNVLNADAGAESVQGSVSRSSNRSKRAGRGGFEEAVESGDAEHDDDRA